MLAAYLTFLSTRFSLSAKTTTEAQGWIYIPRDEALLDDHR